jgi:acetoacetate decarboxylase
MRFALDDEGVAKVKERMAGMEFVFYDAEMLWVLFRTDPEVVRQIVPEPLKPSAEPYATAFVARYPKTNFGSVYNEAALFVTADYGEEMGGYCLAMPVTDDMALIGGRETFGFPKKLADQISLEKTENGVRGSCVRRGVELMNLSMTFEEEVEAEKAIQMLNALTGQEPGEGWKTISYNFKFFQSPRLTGFDYKPRLVKQVTTLKPSSKIKLSSGFNLKLKSSDTDPLGEIPVKEPLMGLYGIFNNTMHPGEVIVEVEEEQFRRYAHFKQDYLPQ